MRKWLLAVTFASVALGPSVNAQNAASDEATLKRLSGDWMDAVARKDRVTLERLLASDFQLVSIGDVQGGVPRAQWLANALRMDWQDRGYSDVRVEINGDTGIVTSNYSFRVDPGEWKPTVSSTSPVVDVWVRRGGQWQVQRRHLAGSTLTRWADRVIGLTVGVAVFLGIMLLRRIATRRRMEPPNSTLQPTPTRAL